MARGLVTHVPGRGTSSRCQTGWMGGTFLVGWGGLAWLDGGVLRGWIKLGPALTSWPSSPIRLSVRNLAFEFPYFKRRPSLAEQLEVYIGIDIFYRFQLAADKFSSHPM